MLTNKLRMRGIAKHSPIPQGGRFPRRAEAAALEKREPGRQCDSVNARKKRFKVGLPRENRGEYSTLGVIALATRLSCRGFENIDLARSHLP